MTEEKRKELADEIGDVLYYVSELCSSFELDMCEIATNNIIKLRDRLKRGVIKGNGDRK